MPVLRLGTIAETADGAKNSEQRRNPVEPPHRYHELNAVAQLTSSPYSDSRISRVSLKPGGCWRVTVRIVDSVHQGPQPRSAGELWCALQILFIRAHQPRSDPKNRV